MALMMGPGRLCHRVVLCKCAERHRLPRRRAHVDFPQRIRRELEVRLHLEDHAVLVELRENDGDLPLAERVVERVVNCLRGDIVARGLLAIHVHAELKPAGLLAARDPPGFGRAAQFREKPRRPVAPEVTGAQSKYAPKKPK